MLKEVDQNTNNSMGSATNSLDAVDRTHLAIHQTNLFQPHKLTVTSLAASPFNAYLAARRGYLDRAEINHPFSQLDFYEINTKTHPKHMQTIIEYEDITGVAWLDQKRLISVSLQATINQYSVHSGSKIKTYTSDFGPITCMRYSIDHDLLVAGTEYGYAVSYRVKPAIECVSKMVKLNESIKAIDLHLEPRDTPVPVIKAPIVVRAKKPGKRKRSVSSGESDDEDEEDAKEDSSAQDVFLAGSDVTIFGACANKIVAWDYHRKTIIDTVISENQVCSILTLTNGDFVIGDSGGYLNIYDRNTFTCRQSEKILKSDVTCLARDRKGHILLAAGKEPVITLSKRNKSSEDGGDDYVLFEQIKDHASQVNDALCATKKDFYTCSQDNTIIKFRNSKSEGHRKLKRFAVRQTNRSKISYNMNELMLIFGKSLHIYHINSDQQFRSQIVSYPVHQSLEEPRRFCTVKANVFVHAATFNDKWICYSTSKGITTIDRPGMSRIGLPSKNLPCCHILKLCQSGNYLVAGQYKTLTVTKLDNDLSQEDNQHPDQQVSEDKSLTSDSDKKGSESKTDAPKPREHRTIAYIKLKGYIRNIFYHESSNRLIVACGTTAHLIYVYEMPSSETEANTTNGNKNTEEVKLVYRTSLRGCSPASHLMLNNNDKNDTNLYIYTTRNQMITHDILTKAFKMDLTDQQVGLISGLPQETNIVGLIVLSQRYALLYDSNYLHKLDMNVNAIVNTTPKYNDINLVCDTIFGKRDEILVV